MPWLDRGPLLHWPPFCLSLSYLFCWWAACLDTWWSSWLTATAVMLLLLTSCFLRATYKPMFDYDDDAGHVMLPKPNWRPRAGHQQSSRAPSVEDDEDGHLIYGNGDVLQDRCSCYEYKPFLFIIVPSILSFITHFIFI